MKPRNIGSKEQRQILSKGPAIEECYNSLECQHKILRSTHRDVEKAVAIARKFNETVIRPIALETDRRCMEDHNYLPYEFAQKAAQWGLYTLFMPKLFGGQGLNFLAIYPFMEEISTSCAGLGHVINLHYCGAATLFPSMNAKVMAKVFWDVAKSEKEGKPRLCTIVVTEPSSGTDVQEPLLVDLARPDSSVEKVKGGYIINGKKIFISNGHLSHWHITNFQEDKNNRGESWIQLVVPNGTKGFSFGTHERKMGQLACCASELLFDDCFVPDSMVSIRAQDPEFKKGKGSRWLGHTVVDHVTASTRTGVAAIATGMARGAYETALEYARHKKIGGRLLINHQWAQIILTDMYRNINVSRTTYMESGYSLTLNGLFKLLFIKPVHVFINVMPRWYFRLISPLLKLKIATKILRQVYYHGYTNKERNLSSGWGSLAKVSCSDLGVANANLAMDLMGADGLRHESSAEKFFRDAKLQQIYESTNDINRMNLFYCLVANDKPEVEFFK